MDDIVHKLIFERTRFDRPDLPWVVDVYFHLIGHGVKHDVAIKAMDEFIDGAVAIKPEAES